MQEEFQRLLDNEKEDDLNRMYNLLHRIPNGLDPLRDRFESHVKRAGLEGVERICGEDKTVEVVRSLFSACIYRADKLLIGQEPKAYVDALLVVHGKNDGLVQRAFKGEPGFVASLDKVCCLRPRRSDRNSFDTVAGLPRIRQPKQSMRIV